MHELLSGLLFFSQKKGMLLPFPWEEMGFYQEENLSSRKKTFLPGRNWEETSKGYSNLTIKTYILHSTV